MSHLPFLLFCFKPDIQCPFLPEAVNNNDLYLWALIGSVSIKKSELLPTGITSIQLGNGRKLI